MQNTLNTPVRPRTYSNAHYSVQGLNARGTAWVTLTAGLYLDNARAAIAGRAELLRVVALTSRGAYVSVVCN